ncbi:WhiB family transcriptional regulator [Georgenia sp. AZ-5]|uniref:WhiB family transcriptional regulator n=1 Tax=Georgenia sp. AZ-5 TaxID=3367526 RepID=UPI00375499D3
MQQDQDWVSQAACAQAAPDALFVRGAAQRTARKVCFGCPVRLRCLAEALAEDISFGVWGGLTERERRALVRRRPDVTDWRAWITEAEDALAEELRQPRPPQMRTNGRQAPALN